MAAQDDVKLNGVRPTRPTSGATSRPTQRQRDHNLKQHDNRPQNNQLHPSPYPSQQRAATKPPDYANKHQLADQHNQDALRSKDHSQPTRRPRSSHRGYSASRRSLFGKWNADVQLWLVLWSLCLILLSAFQIKHFNKPLSVFENAVRLNMLQKTQIQYEQNIDVDVEIFTAPKPMVGIDAINTRRAVKSWIKLNPKPTITLLGDEVGYDELANEFNLNVHKQIDKNFLGVPLFNSMLEHANKSTAKVAVLINADILLFDDFMHTLRKTMSSFENFLVVAARFDVDNLPNDYDQNYLNPDYLSVVRKHVWETGTLHTYGGMDLWAWNTNGPRLFDPVMPHFVFGRGKYDNWLTHETIVAKRRQVIDVSETSLIVHVRHDYHSVTGASSPSSGQTGVYIDPISNQPVMSELSTRTSSTSTNAFWSKGKKSKFELFINIYLSLHVGSYINQMGSVLFAPWKLSRCMQGDGMCLLRRLRPGICNCEASAFVHSTQTDPIVKKGSRVIQCGMISVETKSNFTIPVLPENGEEEAENFGLPLTLKSVIEKIVKNNTVILTAVNYGYRSMLMNMVCNLRQLNVTNFLVASLDKDIYRYAYVRGLPTYYENTIYQKNHRDNQQLAIANAMYGTDAFKMLTKLKSRVVLRLLKIGVHVIWTDCDIVFFKNPILNDLWKHDADLVIQSNAPDNEAANDKRRINSGFYLARSNDRTIQSFQDIITYAAHSRMSEQPCFYDVLCGKVGQFKVGSGECLYPRFQMKVHLLDRNKYANGLSNGIWNTTGGPGSIKRKWRDLVMLHNNWIRGNEKRARFVQHGFIFYDPEVELCTYPGSI